VQPAGPAVAVHSPVAPPPGPATLRLLLSWYGAGRLADLLDRLTLPALSAWHQALVAGWLTPSAPGPVAPPAELGDALAAVPTAELGRDPAALLRTRITALTAVAARTGFTPARPEVLAAVDGRCGPAPVPGPGGAATVAVRRRSPPAAPRRQPRGHVRVGSALPFLGLVPLVRTGWLDALTISVEAAGLRPHWPALATALARAMLAPADTGAAFAGVAQPVADRALRGLARHAEALVPAPNAVLAGALLAGHTPGTPFVLTASDAGAVLLDAEGLFPIAWADDPAELEGWLRWRSPARIITGHDPTDGDLFERATMVVEALRGRVTCRPRLDRCLGLAAGLALGTVAWTLWGAREPTDPVLAIERLSSLDAVVRYADNRVLVLVPLGARHTDLHRHGLLATVPAVPWLDGRPLEIAGG